MQQGYTCSEYLHWWKVCHHSLLLAPLICLQETFAFFVGLYHPCNTTVHTFRQCLLVSFCGVTGKVTTVVVWRMKKESLKEQFRACHLSHLANHCKAGVTVKLPVAENYRTIKNPTSTLFDTHRGRGIAKCESWEHGGPSWQMSLHLTYALKR